MKTTVALFAFAVVCLAQLSAPVRAEAKLKIGIKKRVENCTVKTRKGDMVHMHYTVSGSRPTARPSSIESQPITV